MKEKWLKIKETWTNLALREKQMLSLGGLALLLFIVYQFIWSPLITATAQLRTRIEAQEKTLQWMQAADKKMHNASANSIEKNKSASPVVLLGLLQKQVDQTGLSQCLMQLKQANNEGVEMKFQKVSFDKVMPLLIAISKEQSIAIPQMSVVPLNKPGLVDMDIFIRPEA